MFDKITSDESLLVLLLVCLPLSLLLVAALILRFRFTRSTAMFPGFSVIVSRVGRHETYVSYCSPTTQLEFEAAIRKGRNFFVSEIRVQVPGEMSNRDLSTVVPNLACGLAKLHYQYLIYRKGEPQRISEEERNAAIMELRR